jgi:hypothetical protein
LLILPHGNSEGAGFLVVWLEGRKITIDLTPVKAELILLMNEALRADRKLPPEARGWRADEQIIAALRYPVEKTSLRRSVSKLNRLFREELSKQAPGADTRPLLETKRSIGIRLSWLLELDVPKVPKVELRAAIKSDGSNGKTPKKGRSPYGSLFARVHHRPA